MGNITKNVDFNLVENDLTKRERARKKWSKLKKVILQVNLKKIKLIFFN